MDRVGTAIVGAGIAGVATAYWLAVRHGQAGVALIDKSQPLSFTTAVSGENFRDYWPQPSLHALMSRSIDLMEDMSVDSRGAFDMRFSGYEFVSEFDERDVFSIDAPQPANSRAPGVRITKPHEIRSKRPYLSPSISQVLRIERGGELDVQAFGSWMLREARRAGAELVRGEIVALARASQGHFEIGLQRESGPGAIRADRIVLAAGPLTGGLAGMLGQELPEQCFLQQKIVIPDPLGIIPRDMPFTIFADEQRLDWSDEESAAIAAESEFAWLLDEFPAGLHIKPESGSQIKLGWAYNRAPQAPHWSPAGDDQFPEIVMRGASRFIPALDAYVAEMPGPVHTFAGYYSRTPENLPLIGPLAVENAFINSALSGYGTMAACAAGELCAAWVMGSPTHPFAGHLSPARYEDPRLMAEIAGSGSDGQL